jgi:hypothetical protein
MTLVSLKFHLLAFFFFFFNCALKSAGLNLSQLGLGRYVWLFIGKIDFIDISSV